MKYACLIYQDEAILEKLPKEELNKVSAEHRRFHAAVAKNGQIIAAQGLEPTRTATTVRVRDGKTLTTDGPFAETKEQLGGVYLIEAKDLDEAIQFAAKIPSARFGAIEVRPVWVAQ